jgi:cell division protein FtsQ
MTRGRRPAPGRTRGGTDGATGWEQSGRGRAARERAGVVDDRRLPDGPSTGRTGTGADDRSARRAGSTRRDRRPSDSDDRDSRRTGSGDGATAGWGRSGRTRNAAAGSESGVRRTAHEPDAAASKPRRRFFRRRRPTPQPARPVPAHYRRRRLVAALAAVLVLLVAVGLGTRVLLYDAGFANVQDVTVTGLSTVPEQAVRDAAAVPVGGPLISVDTAGIAQRVAALEGVAQVDVRRAWPHTVEVVVTERVPVALWPTPQALFEVDGTGLPYRRAPQPPPALPRLSFAGVAPQDPSTTAALTVLRDLSEPLRAQVATVDVAGTKVTLGLTDDRSVRWGDPDRAADKIAVLGALLGQPGTVYDVSSPDLPTVRP